MPFISHRSTSTLNSHEANIMLSFHHSMQDIYLSTNLSCADLCTHMVQWLKVSSTHSYIPFQGISRSRIYETVEKGQNSFITGYDRSLLVAVQYIFYPS
ncbi:Piso0_000562 [Millerozyma farinosa CBS 7064]|uniref:Piso0_000562 protein n=1 Tax=Pichia sorbitophila (strain ATCC MYA-4447 / BCRC 22081 / CBS 7064 / NBRC 10061 / NRRL Y-12695) TaxID=559304 RepID=G8YSQ4_PICSO|nr:Piso0_000562 [Millerozyma farinosa CBS 7064]CCE73516.1 Piso0_000562 [Millerozyma farinosa CBS 7064]